MLSDMVLPKNDFPISEEVKKRKWTCHWRRVNRKENINEAQAPSRIAYCQMEIYLVLLMKSLRCSCCDDGCFLVLFSHVFQLEKTCIYYLDFSIVVIFLHQFHHFISSLNKGTFFLCAERHDVSRTVWQSSRILKWYEYTNTNIQTKNISRLHIWYHISYQRITRGRQNQSPHVHHPIFRSFSTFLCS